MIYLASLKNGDLTQNTSDVFNTYFVSTLVAFKDPRGSDNEWIVFVDDQRSVLPIQSCWNGLE